MTTQLAFTFGMLVAVSIAMVIGIVISLVKVYKLEARVKEINRGVHDSIDNIWRHLSQLETDINRRIDESERYTSMELENRNDDIHRRIDETHRQFNVNEDELRRLIDSRFDKFENKIKTTDKKQLLKD